MRASLTALTRKNYFVTIISLVVLFGATAAIADIVSGLATTNSSTNVTITNLTLTKPSDVAAGDVMLAGIALHDGSATSVTPPTGWTQVLRTDNDTSIGIVSYYKVAGASEPSTYTWTLSPQTRAQGGITRYSGVDTSNPIDQAAGNTGRSKTATTSSITTAGTNEEIVAVYAIHQGSSDFAGDFFSAPTGMAEKYDSSYTTAGPTIASFDAVQVAVGAAGSKSSTISGNPNQQRDWASQQIALRKTPVTPSIMDTLPLTAHDHEQFSGESFNYTVPSGGSNQLLVAIIDTDSCSGITSVSQNGQPLTVTHITGTHNRADHCVAYLPAPQSGQFEITLSSAQTINYLLMTIQNAAQTNPLDAVNVVYNSNLTSSQTTSVTTTVGNDLLLARSFYAGPNQQANYDVTVSSYGTGESEIQPVSTYATTGVHGIGPNTGTQKNAAASSGVESMVTHWSLQGDIDELVVAIKPAQ